MKPLRSNGDTLPNDVIEQRLRKGLLEPQGPADFRAEIEGSAIRLVIVDIDHLAMRSSTVSYIVGHVRDPDVSTEAARKSSAGRAEICAPPIVAPRRKGDVATFYLSDSRYQTGAFFCWAVDRDGTRSQRFLWTPKITREIIDTAIPADVSRPQVTESGREASPGVIVSQISVSAVAPSPLGSFDRLQMALKDYHEVGSLVYGESKVHDGQPGGTIQFQFDLSPFRRGVGLITVTNGDDAVHVTGGLLNKQARPGDVIEVLGTRATVLSVSGNEDLLLSAGWTGQSVVDHDAFQILPLVRFLFLSQNGAGMNRTDVLNAPFQDVLLDALMSPPNAPTLTGSTIGNEVLLQWQQVLGTKIARYRLFRCDGVDTPFTDASRREIDTVEQDPSILNTGTLLQSRDTSFEPIERDRGDVFTYYVVAENDRRQQSAPSNGVALPCSANAPSDVDPVVIGRITLHNKLYNAFFSGTSGGNVLDTDTAQDSCNGTDASNVAGKPYGGTGASDGLGRFLGFTRWHGRISAGGGGLPEFLNGDEIRLPQPGAVGEWCDVIQELGAWDNPTPKEVKVGKYSLFVLSVWAMRVGVNVPSGSLEIYLLQMDNDTERGYLPRQYRDTDNTLQYYTGSAAKIVIPGSSLVTTPARFFAVFKTDPDLGVTKQLRVVFRHVNSLLGHIHIKQPKLEDGEVLTGWTGDMGDPSISYPIPTTAIPPIGDKPRWQWPQP